MSTYVLVHGSFQGGWCWEKVVPQLVQAGHHVVALDLPGHGEDTTPVLEVTLESYVHTVQQVVETRKEPVILVGHSFGGMVISQVAERLPQQVKALVYLSALIPQNGLSALQLPNPDGAALMEKIILNQAEGWVFVKEEAIVPTYYNDCTPEDLATVLPRLQVEPFLPYNEPVTLTPENFGQVPRYYIGCTQDHSVTPAFQNAMLTLTPCNQVFTLDSGHSPYISQPAELAAILLQLAVQPMEVA
ncbi:MAG TPA: alpha/beta fold hydrolase [Symbiobacteriaceae bacterium]|nr:alpha/beta fold hydrolase [Symbiobacteriaceae bacterium]